MRLFYENGLEFEGIWVKSYLVNVDIRVQIPCNFNNLFLFAWQHIYAKINRFKAIRGDSGIMAYFFSINGFFFIKFFWDVIRRANPMWNCQKLFLCWDIELRVF